MVNKIVHNEFSKVAKIVFNEPAGKKVLEYLINRYYNQTSYTRDDPYHTAFLEGQREVIRYIKAELNKKDNINE